MSPVDPRLEAAALLGAIGGLLSKRGSIVDVRPVLSSDGSHEIRALRVTTTTGASLVVEVHPDDE